MSLSGFRQDAPSVAVIGAGLSGLSCARRLAAAGAKVTIFEKSRSLGGRCATRRWGDHIVDHGAQFFTMRNAEFQREMEALCGDELRPIDAPVVNLQGREISAGGPRWYHAMGNNRVGKALRGDLSVRMEALITRVERRDEGWDLGEGNGGGFAAVVCSAPLPQTLAVLGREPDLAALAPCLTAFFAYAGEWSGRSREVYARVDPVDDLAWSACENHKMGRIAPATTVFVAQASPGFSREFLEADPAEWAERLRKRLEERWELPRAAARDVFMHRWRYARYCREEAAVVSDLPPGLFVTGDAFSESRVESAWLAGRATAHEVLSSIQRR
ncbi:MAG TPA: FAD-dependent oxidoreductase [Chthoniobacterales bacterium]|jgi:predicted NAD/FAD-dependent oxidoreductase